MEEGRFKNIITHSSQEMCCSKALKDLPLGEIIRTKTFDQSLICQNYLAIGKNEVNWNNVLEEEKQMAGCMKRHPAPSI
uniref:Uncharacterized protein n=1 Tax=Romanomermis culicivorax TaxID=13658 RepID=A0A915K8Z6_ROMCU